MRRVGAIALHAPLASFTFLASDGVCFGRSTANRGRWFLYRSAARLFSRPLLIRRVFANDDARQALSQKAKECACWRADRLSISPIRWHASFLNSGGSGSDRINSRNWSQRACISRRSPMGITGCPTLGPTAVGQVGCPYLFPPRRTTSARQRWDQARYRCARVSIECA